MGRIFKKCLHHLVLFSYVNLLSVQAYGAASYSDAHVYVDIQRRTAVNPKADLDFSLKLYHAKNLVFEAKGQEAVKAANYSFKKKEEGYHLTYRAAGLNILKLAIDAAGNVSFRAQNPVSAPIKPTTLWGIKTHGTLSNHEDLRLYGLYTDANEFINSGSLLLNTFSFSQFYGFNSGVIHIADDLKNINVTDIHKNLKALNITKKPVYTWGRYDNAGYLYSQRGLINTGHHLHNYGLCQLGNLEFRKSGSLTAHQPIAIMGKLEGQAREVINHSYMKLDSIASTFQVQKFVNSDLIVGLKNLSLPVSIVNEGVIINAEGMPYSFDPQQDPLFTDRVFINRLKDFMSPHKIHTAQALNSGPDQQRFYNHKKASLVAMITQVRQSDKGPRFHSFTPLGRLNIKDLIHSLALDTTDDKNLWKTPDTLKYLLYKSQGPHPNLFAWVMNHADFFQDFIKNLGKSNDKKAFQSLPPFMSNGSKEKASYPPPSAETITIMPRAPTRNVDLNLRQEGSVPLFLKQPAFERYPVTLTINREKDEKLFWKFLLKSPAGDKSYSLINERNHFIDTLGIVKIDEQGNLYIKACPGIDTSHIHLNIQTKAAIVLGNMQLAALTATARRVSFYKKFTADFLDLTPEDPKTSSLFCRFSPDVEININKLIQRGGHIVNAGGLKTDARLKLNLLRGIFSNTDSLKGPGGLQLKGHGAFLNFSTSEAQTIQSSLCFFYNAGFLNASDLSHDGQFFINSGDVLVANHACYRSYLFDNRGGRTHSGGKLSLVTTHLNNEQGSINGLQGTAVSLGSINNGGGVIGHDTSKTILAFTHPTVQDLGVLKGITLNLKSPRGLRVPKNGTLIGERSVGFQGAHFYMPTIDIQTPLLQLYVQSFLLPDQASCKKTLFHMDGTQNISLTHPYTTAGSFALCEEGLTTKEAAEAAMIRRFGPGDVPGNVPPSTYTIDIQKSIRADGGMAIYAPRATVHIGDEARNISPEFLFQETFMDAYITKFDLEKGVIATTNSTIWAPQGIHIGRLVEDMTRTMFVTFSNHAHKSFLHNLWGGLYNFSCRFLGRPLPQIYNGAHLMKLPVAKANDALFMFKQHLHLRGPLDHNGRLHGHDLTLQLPTPATCMASDINLSGDLYFKGLGGLFLKLYRERCYFQYSGNGGALGYYNPVLSDGARLELRGEISSTYPVTIANEGGIVYSFQKTAAVTVNSTDINAENFQQITGASQAERDTLFQCDLDDFLSRTNNFINSQVIYPAITSFGSGVVLPADNTRIEGYLTAPLALIPVKGGGLILGSPNPFYIPPQDPIRNLMARGFNIHMTYMPPSLEALRAEIRSQSYTFMMRERFWHDPMLAEAFYKDIADHIVVKQGNTFERAQAPLVFSLSPQFLIDRVREECQDILKRGFIHMNEPIDEACVKQLHRNTTEYLNLYHAKLNDLSQAITPFNASRSRYPDPANPLLFYLCLVNDQGFKELQPYLVFPIKMMEEARGQRGGLMRFNTLAIFPDGLSAKATLDSLKDRPLLQQKMITFLKENPSAKDHLNQSAALADAAALALVRSQKAAADATARRLAAAAAAQKVIADAAVQKLEAHAAAQKLAASQKAEADALKAQRSASAPVTIYGTVIADRGSLINRGPVTIHGHLKSREALIMSLDESVIVQSIKQRVGSGDNFYEHIPHQAQLEAQNILEILAGEHVIFQGAKTTSGDLGTHITALASILDIPVELVSQQVEHFTGKKSGTATTRTANQTVSKHKSTGPINLTAGDNFRSIAGDYEADSMNVDAKNGIALTETHNTTNYEENAVTKSRGPFSKTTRSQSSSSSATSQGPKLKMNKKVAMKTSGGNVELTNATFESTNGETSTIEAPLGNAYVNAGTNSSQSQSSRQSSDIFWQLGQQKSEEHQTYSPCTFGSPVEILAKHTFIQRVEGQEPDPNLHVLGEQTVQILQELHRSSSLSVSGPSAGLAALVSVVVMIATGGSGAALAPMLGAATDGIVAAMLSVGVGAVGSQLAMGSLNNHGDPFKAMESLVTADFLKSLAVSMAAAGLGPKLPGVDADLIQKATVHLARNAIRAGLSVGIQGVDIKDAVENALHTTVADTMGQFLANNIGKAYEKGHIGFMTHKILHGASGAVGAGIVGQDMVSGAFGAAVAETLSEQLRSEQAEVLEQLSRDNPGLARRQILGLYEKDVQGKLDLIKAETAVLALVLGQDVATATEQAINALDNNCVPLLLAGAALWAAATPEIVFVGMTSYALLQAIDELAVAYESDSVIGAVNHAVKAGLITASAGIGGVGTAYHVGTATFLSSRSAWASLVKQVPELGAKIAPIRNAEKGLLGEARAQAEMKFKDYAFLDCRLPRNHGIDGVFVKHDKAGKVIDIVVTESKYAAKGGNPKLAWSRQGEDKAQQLSNGWMGKQLERMKNIHPGTYDVLKQNRDKIRFKANVFDEKGINRWYDYGRYNSQDTANRAVRAITSKGRQ